MIGTLVDGLPETAGRYTGRGVEWLSVFPVLCGLGLCFAYVLLGACWLLKTYEGAAREQGRSFVPRLAGGLLGFFAFLFFYTSADLAVLVRWLEQPFLLALPGVGIVTVFLLAVTARHEPSQLPLYMTFLIFAAGFDTISVSFWPYLIPFSVTIEQAAAPLATPPFHSWTALLVPHYSSSTRSGISSALT
ncbi:cytochrome d ubiquinol oxidase subunit II [Bradyrhizobium sp. PMVTL-01]|uniref:cytochrome d ubiquinol oxidase subunit II n=1 Tax=unclassified Bradyrhizobium TaxID=2631580 RepID=UPI003F6E4D4E